MNCRVEVRETDTHGETHAIAFDSLDAAWSRYMALAGHDALVRVQLVDVACGEIVIKEWRR